MGEPVDNLQELTKSYVAKRPVDFEKSKNYHLKPKYSKTITCKKISSRKQRGKKPLSKNCSFGPDLPYTYIYLRIAHLIA